MRKLTIKEEQLSPTEMVTFKRTEAVIADGINSFVSVGSALMAIRDGALYRATHKTFETYCAERWGMQRRRAYQLMDACQVSRNVYQGTQTENPVDNEIPSSEKQIRPLVSFSPDEQRAIWGEAVKTAPKASNGHAKVTARHVAAVAQQHKPKPTPKPEPFGDVPFGDDEPTPVPAEAETKKEARAILAGEKEEPEKKTYAEPYGEFNAMVAELAEEIRALARKVQGALGLQKNGDKAIKWTQFMSYKSTVGDLYSVAKSLEEDCPGELCDGQYGFKPARDINLHKQIQKARASA